MGHFYPPPQDYLKAGEKANDKFYVELYNLGYRTAKDAIPALEEGLVPVEIVNNFLENGTPEIILGMIDAIKRGYIETKKANSRAITAFEETEKKYLESCEEILNDVYIEYIQTKN